MLVPVLQLIKDGCYRVYIDGVLFAVCIPVVTAACWRCIDIHTGTIYPGSTCHEAVDIYFNHVKECLCYE